MASRRCFTYCSPGPVAACCSPCHLNRPHDTPSSIRRKTAFHQASPWCQKGWGPLQGSESSPLPVCPALPFSATELPLPDLDMKFPSLTMSLAMRFTSYDEIIVSSCLRLLEIAQRQIRRVREFHHRIR